MGVTPDAIGLIPAAGKGLRLALPYPKELYPVIRDGRYKPVSQFVLDNLVSAGVSHIIVVINETKSQLIGYFGSGRRFGCRLTYVVQEPRTEDGQSTSPGLADALDAAHHVVAGRTVYFGMADTIMEPQDVFARACAGAEPDDDVVLALFPTGRPEKFGMVRLDGTGRVLEIVDKPKETGLTDMWGCIIWRPRFTEFLHDAVRAGASDFAAILNAGVRDGLRLRGVSIPGGTFRDLGTYEEVLELDQTTRQP